MTHQVTSDSSSCGFILNDWANELLLHLALLLTHAHIYCDSPEQFTRFIWIIWKCNQKLSCKKTNIRMLPAEHHDDVLKHKRNRKTNFRVFISFLPPNCNKITKMKEYLHILKQSRCPADGSPWRHCGEQQLCLHSQTSWSVQIYMNAGFYGLSTGQVRAQQTRLNSPLSTFNAKIQRNLRKGGVGLGVGVGGLQRCLPSFILQR